jgi:hypothetical protein
VRGGARGVASCPEGRVWVSFLLVLKRLVLVGAGGVLALSLGWFVFRYVAVLGEFFFFNCP